MASVPSTLECSLAPPSLDWTGVPWLSAVLASSLTLWAGVGADLKQQGFFIGLSLWLLKMGLGGILPVCGSVCLHFSALCHAQAEKDKWTHGLAPPLSSRLQGRLICHHYL